LASVSQPSMSRFATALGFSGFAEMRNHFRALGKGTTSETSGAPSVNKYTSAIIAEAQNVSNLAAGFSDIKQVRAAGKSLAASRPLPVLGLRVSAGLAEYFSYFAAKVHPDIRLLAEGGSLIEDQLEQAREAGATCLLAFALPLYPRETLSAIALAKSLDMSVIAITDTAFNVEKHKIDRAFTGQLHSGLVFDCWTVGSVLTTILLDAMCDAIPETERRLQARDKSTRQRKVFER
jgi:DNA-binding MurR/RpiR family transcriptional regulator